jgi:hypothetical protein
MKRLILTVLACIACVDESRGETKVASSGSKPERIYIDLPEGIGAKKLCIIVTDEWRLNYNSVVRQRRTLEGDTRVLESDAVVVDPADPLLQEARSFVWPYPGREPSPLAQLPEAAHQHPVTAGIQSIDQIVSYAIVVQYRHAPGEPWVLMNPEGTPIFERLWFDWVNDGVYEGTDYSRNLEQARNDKDFGAMFSSILASVGRSVLGPAKISGIPPNKATLLRDFLAQRGQVVEDVESRRAVYLLTEQCGRAVVDNAAKDGYGCIRHPLYVLGPKNGKWKPEVRLIPVPYTLERSDAEWLSENSSAAVLPATWKFEEPYRLAEPLFRDPPESNFETDKVAWLDLPAQVMLPAGPPRVLVDRLRERPHVAILRGEELREHRWDLARMISSDELQQHRRIHLAMRRPTRDVVDWRFQLFYSTGLIDNAAPVWERLPDPDGLGFTDLDLDVEENHIAFLGTRRNIRLPPVRNQGTLKGNDYRLLIVAFPPADVRGIRSPEQPRWMPQGLDHSNWKWLVVTVE